MKSIAIIPARSGSKGVKDKNIRDLCGKPLIAYSIIAATESKMFDTVMVSTDSEKYAEIARQYGAEVPFLRGADLSGDTADSWDVVREVLKRYKDGGKDFDTVMLLQPTSPLRTSDDIVKAFGRMKEKNAEAVISVCETEHSPLFCNTLSESLSMKNFINFTVVQRQQLQKYYRLNGAIYLLNVAALYKGKNIYDNDCYAYVMDTNKSLDIDTEQDFFFAEALMSK